VTFRYGGSLVKGRLVTGAAAVIALVSSTLIVGTPAFAGVSSADAATLAAALSAPGGPVTAASFATVPGGTPNGVGDAPLAGFPTDGSTFAILTTGDVNSALLAPPSHAPGTTTELGGAPVRGDTDHDVTILKVDFTVATGMNCLTFDFRFLSEEYPEFLNTEFNDAFIAELDTSDWSTAGSAINAPHNFAFDPANQPISIDAAGNTSMVAGPDDTTYDGATPVLSAAAAVTPGAHSLYLSIFDQGDERFDSAVLVDNLVVGHASDMSAQCSQGATPKTFELGLTPATASKTVGTSHTVTATLKDLSNGPVGGAPILFAVTGANPGTGTGSTNASGVVEFSYTGTHAGDDAITACYDVNGDAVCGAGEPFASVAATWTGDGPATTPAPTAGGSEPILAVTGSPTGTIAGIGVLCIAVGAAFVLLVRRRRVAAVGGPDRETPEGE
jgi:hypothetical protein